MEKNDVQSGGPDPVPKQLFSSLIYSTGHLVHPLTTNQQHIQTQFTKHQGKGRWIIGSIWSGGLPSPLCSVLITLNLQFRKKCLKCLMEELRHEPNAVFIHPWVLQLHYSQLSLYAETLLIKGILWCLAGSLQKCKRVKSSFKKHQWEESYETQTQRLKAWVFGTGTFISR